MVEWIPHGYQEHVVDRAVRQEALGEFLDPGLGKTSIMLETFRRLKARCDVERMLVIAPLRVCHSVWPREARKWKQFADLRVHVLHGDGLQDYYLRPGAADVLVVNPEGLEWLEERQEWLPEMLTVDESTQFKKLVSHKSERGKRLRRLLPRFGRRYILTGTPVPNGLLDLHGQIFILDGGAALGQGIGAYKSQFFVSVQTGQGGSRVKWTPRPGAMEAISEKLAHLVVRLDAKDYLDLPEKVNVSVEVDMPPAARATYGKLREELVVEMAEGTVAAVSASALTGKCRQIANGSVYVSDAGIFSINQTRRSVVVHTAKAEALCSIVEELSGASLLVGFEHRHELEVIRQTLGYRVPSIDGSTSAAEGDRLATMWNRGGVPVLCAHPASAGYGLNLQEGGHHLAWYSIPWRLDLYDQMVGRVWRQGQTERTFIYHLTAADTIDQTVTRVLAQKARTQDDLLTALRADLGAGAFDRQVEERRLAGYREDDEEPIGGPPWE